MPLIKKLEKKLAPDRVWKNLDLGPAQQEALMDRLIECSYPAEQVEALHAKASDEQIAIEGDRPLIPCPPGTKWEEICITLVANDTVRIQTPHVEGRFQFSALGLQDKRKGDAPGMLWELLKVFAKNNGSITRTNIEYNRKLTDTAKRLNRRMKEIFGIRESIFKAHYKKERGYRTRIIFRDTTFGMKSSD